MSFRATEGSLAGMRSLAGNIRKLAGVPSQAAKQAAEDIEDSIREQFANGNDPYGNPWKPLSAATRLKPRVGGILVRTGAGEGSVAVRPMRGAGISVTLADYFAFHQTGFRNGSARVPARQVLPWKAMPDTWQRAIADACEGAFERQLKA